MSAQTSIVWFRQGLRVEDYPALNTAVRHGGPVIPVFIWASGHDGGWAPDAASRWWLDKSLRSLEAALRRRGSRLIVGWGDDVTALRSLTSATGGTAGLLEPVL